MCWGTSIHLQNKRQDGIDIVGDFTIFRPLICTETGASRSQPQSQDFHTDVRWGIYTKNVNGSSISTSLTHPPPPLVLACLSPQISFSPLIIQCLAWHGVETILHTPINTKTCLRKTNAFCFPFWSSFNNVLEPPFPDVWGSAGKQDIHQIDRQNKLQGKQNLNVSPELMVSRLVGRRPRHLHAAAVTLVWSCSSNSQKCPTAKERGMTSG